MSDSVGMYCPASVGTVVPVTDTELYVRSRLHSRTQHDQADTKDRLGTAASAGPAEAVRAVQAEHGYGACHIVVVVMGGGCRHCRRKSHITL